MRYKEHIQALNRYSINDIERSPFWRLDKNEFCTTFPPHILEAFRGRVTDYSLQAYPSTFQTNAKAASLLDHVDERQVLLLPGSDYALKLCYEAFLEPDDAVCLPEPTYAMNSVFATLAKSRISLLPYSSDFTLDRRATLDRIAGARMLVLANPNQPTGRLEDSAFIESLLETCRRQETWVILDEAYWSFSGWTAAPFLKRFPNLIVVRSFSKSYGLAGLRLGAVIANSENVQYLANALPVYPVNSFALACLDVLLEHRSYFLSIVQEMCAVRNKISALYRGLGFDPHDSATNFVMVEAPSKFDAQAYIDFLKQNGILIRGPWTRPPYKNAFRVTLCGSKEFELLESATKRYARDVQVL